MFPRVLPVLQKKKGSHVLRSLGLRDIEIEGYKVLALFSPTPKRIDSCISELKAAVEDIRMIIRNLKEIVYFNTNNQKW